MSPLAMNRTFAGIILMSCALSPVQGGDAAAAAAPPGAGLDEQFGHRLPADLAFRDQDGRLLQLGEVFDGRRPILLIPAYFHCPMLCGLVLEAAVTAAKGMDWIPGDQYRVVVVSFDRNDGPVEAIRKQQAVLAAAPSDPRFTAARWPFLTGTQPAIDGLLGAIGERVHRDGDDFSHPAVMVVLSGDGVVSRYLYGIETPRDLKLALLEASAGRTGTLTERMLMYCYHFDPAQHRYGLFVVGFLRIGGMLTLVLFLGLIWWLVRRERRLAAT